jgi:transcriptional regulator with XRE-family HTH domain
MAEPDLNFYSTVDVEALASRDPESHEAFRRRLDILEAAQLIRDMRQSVNLSQEALGERIGVKGSRISEMERATGPQGPTYTLLKRIARACNVTLGAQLRALERETQEEEWGCYEQLFNDGTSRVDRISLKPHHPGEFSTDQSPKILVVTSGSIVIQSAACKWHEKLQEGEARRLPAGWQGSLENALEHVSQAIFISSEIKDVPEARDEA